MIIKELTRRDIMELLCISAKQFEWAVLKLKISCKIELNQRIFNIQDMIDIYDYRDRKNKVFDRFETFESKINLKEKIYESRINID